MSEYADKVIIDSTMFVVKSDRLANPNDAGQNYLFKDMEWNDFTVKVPYQRNSIEEDKHGNENKESIRLPKEVLNRTAHERYYDILNRQSYIFNWGFALLGEGYQQRMERNRAYVRVGETFFDVNTAKNRLIGIHNGEVLDLDEFKKVQNGRKNLLTAYYDTDLKKIVGTEPDDIKRPEHTIYLKVPEMKVLDPVGVALMEGKAAYHYLNAHSIDSKNAIDALDLRYSPAARLVGNLAKPELIQAVDKEAKKRGFSL